MPKSDPRLDYPEFFMHMSLVFFSSDFHQPRSLDATVNQRLNKVHRFVAEEKAVELELTQPFNARMAEL